MATNATIVEIPYVTGKAGIDASGLLKGKGNSDSLTIAAKTYTPGTLVFLGFVAPPPPDLSPGDKLWHGVLRFQAGKSEVEDRFGFAEFVESTTRMDGET